MDLWNSSSPEVIATAIASTIAVLAVWIPFWRGLRLVLRARAATSCEMRTPDDSGESMAQLLLRLLEESFAENQAGHPEAFLRDASKQCVLHEYEESFERPLVMYANLLPPIGFVGTTLGLIVLFASMNLTNRSLEIGALGLALTSTFFALTSFATLEACKVALYKRLHRSLTTALAQ